MILEKRKKRILKYGIHFLYFEYIEKLKINGMIKLRQIHEETVKNG